MVVALQMIYIYLVACGIEKKSILILTFHFGGVDDVILSKKNIGGVDDVILSKKYWWRR